MRAEHGLQLCPWKLRSLQTTGPARSQPSPSVLLLKGSVPRRNDLGVNRKPSRTSEDCVYSSRKVPEAQDIQW